MAGAPSEVPHLDIELRGAYGAWLHSRERTKVRKGHLAWRLVGAGAVVAALVLLGFGFSKRGSAYTVDWILLGWAIGLATGGGLTLLIEQVNYHSRKAAFMREWRREAVFLSLDDVDGQVGDLIRFNQRRVDQYHELTLAQAQSAERNCQLAMAAGLLVLVGGIAVAAAVPSGNAAKVVVGSLTAIGTMLAGYVTRTFLEDRRIALRQLGHFFEQPVTTGYLLTAERLAAKIEGADGNRILARIVESTMEHAFGAGSRPGGRTSVKAPAAGADSGPGEGEVGDAARSGDHLDVEALLQPFHPFPERFAPPQQDGHHDHVQVVDQVGGEELADGGRPAADPDVQVAGGLPGGS